MLYRMMNDARARSVAKDLQQIATELGMKLGLTSSQRLTAVLMGYSDWRHLQSEIGNISPPATADGIPSASGPEDNELTPQQLTDRISFQSAVLLRAGFPENRVQEVLARVRPTGRSRDTAARQVVAYPQSERYHPNRLGNAWSSLHEHCVHSNREFEGFYYEAINILQDWAAGRTLGKLDQEVIANVGDETLTNLEVMMSDAGERGWLIDASALQGLDATRIDGATLTSFPNDWNSDAVYVHLGRNAFPSPYGDVGVEGVYLEVDRTETTGSPTEFHICATLVCSEPPYPQSNYEADNCRNPAIRFRDNLRCMNTMFYAEGEDDLQSSIDYKRSERANASDNAWADFLSAPINTAMNALGIYLRREVPIFDAVPNVSQAIRKRVERAATDKQFFSAVEEAEADNAFSRALAAAPKDKYEVHNLRSDPTGFHIPDARSVHVLIEDSFNLESEDAVRFMRMVHDAAYVRREDSPTDGKAWVRSLAALLQAELHSGDYSGAMRTASDLEYSDTPSTGTYLPLAWLTKRLLGSEHEAARLEKALGQIAFKPLVEDALKRLGDVDPVPNFMENGAHRPFMVQSLEADPKKRANVFEYTDEWHYGHSDFDDVQMAREAWLAGPGGK